MQNFKTLTKKLTSITFIRYVVVGVLTNLIDLVTYQIMVFIGINYLIADTINNPLVLAFNYFSHKIFTFQTKHETKKDHAKEVGKYLFNTFVVYIYAIGVLFIFVDLLKIDPFIGKILQLLSIPLVNYLLLSKFVFRK